MLVPDASILAPALADDGPDGDRARARLRGESLVAPEVIDLEVTSLLRRGVRIGSLDGRRAEFAVADLAALPLQRVSHARLVTRCWALRENLTVYDAAYVALAEALGAVLVTADRGMARAPGSTCAIELMQPAARPEAAVSGRGSPGTIGAARLNAR